MSEPASGAWPCWACGVEIDGPIYQALSVDEKWKGQWERRGSVMHVSLCLDCGRLVRDLLGAIRRRTTTPPEAGS